MPNRTAWWSDPTETTRIVLNDLKRFEWPTTIGQNTERNKIPNPDLNQDSNSGRLVLRQASLVHSTKIHILVGNFFFKWFPGTLFLPPVYFGVADEKQCK